MNSRHPDPRRVWMGGPEHQFWLTFGATAGTGGVFRGPQLLATLPLMFKYKLPEFYSFWYFTTKSSFPCRRNAYLLRRYCFGSRPQCILFAEMSTFSNPSITFDHLFLPKSHFLSGCPGLFQYIGPRTPPGRSQAGWPPTRSADCPHGRPTPLSPQVAHVQQVCGRLPRQGF